jgi:hypothetical protein
MYLFSLSQAPLNVSFSFSNSRTAYLVLRRVLVRIWIFESFGKRSATSLQVHWLFASRICVATQAENELQLLFMFQTFGHQSEVSTHLAFLADRQGFHSSKGSDDGSLAMNRFCASRSI